MLEPAANIVANLVWPKIELKTHFESRTHNILRPLKQKYERIENRTFASKKCCANVIIATGHRTMSSRLEFYSIEIFFFRRMYELSVKSKF